MTAATILTTIGSTALGTFFALYAASFWFIWRAPEAITSMQFVYRRDRLHEELHWTQRLKVGMALRRGEALHDPQLTAYSAELAALTLRVYRTLWNWIPIFPLAVFILTWPTGMALSGEPFPRFGLPPGTWYAFLPFGLVLVVVLVVDYPPRRRVRVRRMLRRSGLDVDGHADRWDSADPER